MTENEAIKAIENDLEWHSKELKPKYKEVLRFAIQTLEEIQRYRDLGTVDEMAETQVQYYNLFHKMRKYQAIGTVEDIQEVMALCKSLQETVCRYMDIGTVEEVKNAYAKGYNQGTIDRAEEITKAREYGYNKAIDEYMNALCDKCMDMKNECYQLECPFCSDGCDIVNIAERLKAGGE